MFQIIWIICLTLIALRCISSIDKYKDAEILRLKKELKKMEGNNYEQRNYNNKSKQFYNGNRK